jgi:hypothetical protein
MFQRSRIIAVLGAGALSAAIAGCADGTQVPLANVPQINTPAPRLPHPGGGPRKSRDRYAPTVVTPPREN